MRSPPLNHPGSRSAPNGGPSRPARGRHARIVAHRFAPVPTDSVTLHVDAPPEAVWRLVSDITNTSRFNAETFEAEWIDGSTGPEVGARFRGHVKRNGRGPTYWTKCTVVVSEPGREFAFVVGTPKNHPMTWGYRLQAADGGTDITEFYDLAENLPL